jgi:hypothetical protein
MTAKVGVLVIHGAGGATFTRQEKFISKLHKYFDRKNFPKETIAFEHIDWYHPTESHQQEIWNRLSGAGYRLRSNMLRKFIMFLVGDMVAYTGIPNRESSTYKETHTMIFKHLQDLQAKTHEKAPLVILASSLGASLITDYIWDRQKGHKPTLGSTPFEKLETLTAMYLLGNNIPLYATAYHPDNLEPITFPPEKLDSKYKPLTTFINIFDRHDPLGFPLKPLNDQYNQVVSEDKEMNVGNIFTSWNIGSHLAYWNSRKIRKLIGNYLMNLSKSL